MQGSTAEIQNRTHRNLIGRSRPFGRLSSPSIILRPLFLVELSFPQGKIGVRFKNIGSLRDFRPLRYSSWNGHAEGEHVNRGRDTPSFCPNLQVLDMSTLGDAADVNAVIKFLPHT